MHPELESTPSSLYIKDGTTGEVVLLGNIKYSKLKSAEPISNKQRTMNESFKALSNAAFETTIMLNKLNRLWRLYETNNWRRNHGRPARRKRRAKYGQ